MHHNTSSVVNGDSFTHRRKEEVPGLKDSCAIAFMVQFSIPEDLATPGKAQNDVAIMGMTLSSWKEEKIPRTQAVNVRTKTTFNTSSTMKNSKP